MSPEELETLLFDCAEDIKENHDVDDYGDQLLHVFIDRVIFNYDA